MSSLSLFSVKQMIEAVLYLIHMSSGYGGRNPYLEMIRKIDAFRIRTKGMF